MGLQIDDEVFQKRIGLYFHQVRVYTICYGRSGNGFPTSYDDFFFFLRFRFFLGEEFAFSASVSSFGEPPKFNRGRLIISARCAGVNSGVAVGETPTSFTADVKAGFGGDCVGDLRGAPETLEAGKGILARVADDEPVTIWAGASYGALPTAVVG
jgi:hypothetical protein